MISWFTGQTILLQQLAVNVLLALSFQVVLRSGVFSFASVGFFGLGAYLGANLAMHHVPVIGVLVAVAVASWIVGYGLARMFAGLRGLYLGMITFAFDQIVVVLGENGGSFTGGAVGLYGIPLALTTAEALLLAFLGCVVMSQLERRALGRAIAILRVDERLGRAQGFAVDSQRRFVFALSATLGGLAGVTSALLTTTIGPTDFGYELIVTGLTMAVVGGVVSWAGAAIGAFAVTWFPTFAQGLASYQALVYFTLIVVVVVLEPNGVVGLIRRGTYALWAGRRRALQRADREGAEVRE